MSSIKKDRADLVLIKQGLFESRSKAKHAIMAGLVRIGADHVVRNASEKVPLDAQLNVEEPFPFVSRGALKLQAALKQYVPDLNEMIALDVGASTGGFTDLMLQSGAAKVYAIDVGTGQLHYKLRNDERVISIEQFNARELSANEVPEPIHIMTCDVSFISVTKVLPPAAALLATGAWAFILIKPQFEAKRSEIAKGGVVRDDEVRHRVADEICRFATTDLKWTLVDLQESPIKGPKGNHEFMAVFRNGDSE